MGPNEKRSKLTAVPPPPNAARGIFRRTNSRKNLSVGTCQGLSPVTTAQHELVDSSGDQDLLNGKIAF